MFYKLNITTSGHPVKKWQRCHYQVQPSDSIAGIRGYKCWTTNYRRFVLQEFYAFDRKFKLQICK